MGTSTFKLIGLSEFLKKNACFQASHFVCEWGQGGGDGGVWGWVCGCVNDVCMEVTGC